MPRILGSFGFCNGVTPRRTECKAWDGPSIRGPACKALCASVGQKAVCCVTPPTRQSRETRSTRTCWLSSRLMCCNDIVLNDFLQLYRSRCSHPGLRHIRMQASTHPWPLLRSSRNTRKTLFVIGALGVLRSFPKVRHGPLKSIISWPFLSSAPC